jgi:Wzt C-terminal domain
MLLESGVADVIGDPTGVAERFIEIILPTTHDRSVAGRDAPGVAAAWLADPAGRATQTVKAGDSVSFCATVRGGEQPTALSLSVELLKHPEGVTLASFRVAGDQAFPPLSSGEQATVRLEIEAGALQPGEYRLRYELVAGDAGRIIDRSSDPLRLRVIGEERGSGVIDIPYRVAVDRDVREMRR